MRIAFRAATRGIVFLAVVTVASAQVQFVDVSGAAGFLAYNSEFGLGSGAVAVDIDDDGDIDLFVPTPAGAANQLYRNLGNGQFEEVAAAFGLDAQASARVALSFDFDGDHLLDLVVAGDCYLADPTCMDTSTLFFYRQASPGQFAEVTETAGPSDDLVDDIEHHRGGMAAGDINGDGYLDLLTTLWNGEKRLFLNNADGTFTDIRVASGLSPGIRPHHQPMMADFDDDGWLDLFFAIDFQENQLWLNQGDYTFVEVAVSANLNNAMNDMGVSLGDFDRDSDLDIYITNITGSGRHNVLHRNDSTVTGPQFVEISQTAGVDQGGWGWGTTFLDADNDGWLDIAATNGYFGQVYVDPSRFYRNQGGDPPTFADVSAAVGFDDMLWGSALLSFDYDRDGFLDLFQVCIDGGASPAALRLLENQPGAAAAANNYLVIQPRMSGANHRAIGAMVTAQIGTLELVRLIHAGTSYMGQEPAEAFFGVGAAQTVDSVTIDWPDGTADTVLTDVAANQVLQVAVDTDTDGDSLIDAVDPDDDDDGTVDGDDCFPTNAQFWAVPGGIDDLTLSRSGGSTTLGWSTPGSPGGSFVAYDVLVSSEAADFDGSASCIESWDPSDTSAVDDVDPAVGETRHFVVVPRNSCGRGPAGSGPAGAPRTVRPCR